MFGISPLTPAYGRTYNSLKAVQDDFDAGKDFNTPFSGYINKEQLLGKTASIQVRYGKNLSKTAMLKVAKDAKTN